MTTQTDPTKDNPIKDWLPEYAPCAWCGRKVPRYAAQWGPYPAGSPNVSGSMSHIDPTGIFCTMRCAASYGVRAAKAKP
jgi:uncharacterized protein with LGFP repeats